ncbi:MAG: STAS domain-containing protein [Lachnospiraceae bacterium]|nr:STAS domain-containing protein [Lachnospiraceae bacterium]
MKNEIREGNIIYYLTGRIDSSNAQQFENDLNNGDVIMDAMDIVFDVGALEYISSAGLRVLLKVKKSTKRNVKIVNVSDEIFDILDVTGFYNIFEIERKMRSISIKGCDKISSALNGEIFKLSDDEMLKVYGKDVALDDIKKERSYAQTAMIFGVPTLIPYDVVRCEAGYGLIFEKAETTSLANVIKNDPGSINGYATLLAKLFKELHKTEIPEGKLPDIKDRYRKWIIETDDPDDSKISVFSNLINSIQDSPNYVHGDINLNSVMVQNGELILLDMSGSARGHALFDLQGLFASLVGIENKTKGYCEKTYGLSKEVCIAFWNAFFGEYMGGNKQEISSMNELLARYFILKENILTKLEKKHRL